MNNRDTGVLNFVVWDKSVRFEKEKGKLTMDSMLSKALREFLSGPLNQLIVNLGGEDGAVWEAELKKFNRKEPCWSTRNPYLRQIATGKLVVTAGKRTLSKAEELFPGWLDPDFTNWGTDVPGEAKPETPFEVYELVKDGTFAQVFGAFGVELDKLCWSQDQIMTFVENHANLLHPKGWATLFLFKAGEEFFVAHVYRSDGGQLKADVFRLSDGHVWGAGSRNRFVIPQLETPKL